MYPREFDYVAPTTLDEALDILGREEDAKAMAGGMSLLPLMKLRLFSPSLVVDLGRIAGMDGIDDRDDHIAIGALVRHRATARSELVKEHALALATAASWTGDVQVRNRGTTCGSVAHVDVAGDQPAAALALGATMIVRSTAGEREIPAEDFFVDTLTSALEADEILVELRIPKRQPGEGSAYDKLGRRGGHSDYAIAGAAAWVRLQNGSVSAARVALTGASTKPVLAQGVAETLIGTDGSSEAIAAAAEYAPEGITILEDLFGSEDYKAHLARVFAGRALETAVQAAR
ncbi:MAG: FAD binding domain-containing protein, partial [Acidimicrobiia bacterium]